jgi:hypothetical protein
MGILSRFKGMVSETTEPSDAKVELDSALKKASAVVAAYGAVLEQVGETGILLHSESDLPFTKAEIRRSIEVLLIVSTDDTKRNNLEVADMLLNDFVPDEDYSVVQHQREDCPRH